MKIKALIITFLLVTTLYSNVRHWQTPGIDFYHYWAVAKAKQFDKNIINNPYADSTPYFTALSQEVAVTKDPLLKESHEFRKGLDLTGTPLMYSFFKLLPSSYTFSLYLFRSLQLLLFIGAIWLLGFFLGVREDYLVLGLILSIFYEPFLIDMRVGNLNTFQFFLFAMLTTYIDNFQLKSKKIFGIIPFDILFLFSLVFIVLFKPNTLLTAILLGVTVVLKGAFSPIWKYALIGLAFVVLLVGESSLFFQSSAVWKDWYSLITASRDRLAYPIDLGNYSFPLFISEGTGHPYYEVSLWTVASLVITFLAATFISLESAQRNLTALSQRLITLGRNPYLCTGVAAVVTLAISPLVWSHYYTFLLLPALWLVSSVDTSRLASFMGGFAILFSGGAIARLLATFNVIDDKTIAFTFMAGWILVWLGILCFVKDSGWIDNQAV
jgi:hypothetical protein